MISRPNFVLLLLLKGCFREFRFFVWICLDQKLIYLTIRLRARDLYEVIVDEGEARINYHFVEIESE